MFLLPLAILAITASYISGIGLASFWPVPFPAQFVVSAALQGAHILGAAKANRVLTVVTWCACLYFTRAGMALFGSDHPILPAAVLEATCLLLAGAKDERIPFSEHVARWRREQARIAMQFRMSEGFIPWLGRCARQAINGVPETSAGYEPLRVAAEMADSENRLRVRIAKTAIPEQLRQSILTGAARIAAKAETSAARHATELEAMALEAAAVCRDECSGIVDLPVADRRALADQCEQAFVEFIQPRGGRYE